MGKPAQDRPPPSAELGSGPETYFEIVRRPWPSLLFLAPLIVFYEIAAILLLQDPDSGVAITLTSRTALHEVFAVFGVSGAFLPGFVAVGVLTAWHLYASHPWSVPLRVFPAMAVESLLLTAPLYLITLAIFREPTAAQSIMSLDPAGSEPGVSLASRLTLAVGAGIYEELVFRLIAVSLLHLIVTDLFKGGDVAGAAIAVIGSAALFAAHHYWPASRSFAFPASMPEATFYFAAGLYFAAIFHFRGFGVVAGVHIAYDVLANL